MNAPYSPSPDPDELASALVDGLLSEEEADRARQDPAIIRRVEEIRRVRGQLRATPPPPPGHAEQAVAAALADFDPRVRPLRRTEPWAPQRSRRAAGWLAAAAAILVVALVAAVGLTSTGDDDEAATGSADQSESMETSDDAGSDEESGDAAEAPSSGDEDRDTSAEVSDAPFAVSDVVDLGTAETVDDLTESVAAARTDVVPEEGQPGGGNATSALPESSPACLGTSPDGDTGLGVVTFVGRATFQGEDVIVHLYRTAGGTERMVVTNADCVDVVDEPYPG